VSGAAVEHRRPGSLNRAIELAGLRMVRNLGKRLGASRVVVLASEHYVRDQLQQGQNLHIAALKASAVITREFFDREEPPCSIPAV
jgi:hypothetical protein